MDARRINELCEQNQDRIIGIRRQIHSHPELSDQETETSKLVQAELRRLGVEAHTFAGMTAVMGVIRGGRGPGGTVGLRADMDALPLDERTGLPFASQNPGVMHACGHDAHTSILLGAAAVLQELRDSFAGTVKLFFQPAEEGDGGAKRMIAQGCMENPHVDEVFGLHVGESLAAGQIGAKKGGINAYSDEFTITVRGKKSHGAAPVEGIDAIYVASQIVVALHAMCSRRVGPTEAVALNVGTFHGGRANNIICDEVEMSVMFRTMDLTVRERVAAEMESLTRGICAAHGAQVDFVRQRGCDCQFNDDALVDRLEQVCGAVLGPGHFEPFRWQGLGTEDFCFFGQCAPSVFYYIGSASAPGHPFAPSHSSEFTIDERCIGAGMRIQVGMALDALERLEKK